MHKVLVGQRLVTVEADPRDRIAFDRASPLQFKKALAGARVTGSGRRGKYFWLELDRRPWPVFHLGMTGNVVIEKSLVLELHNGAQLKSASRFRRLRLVGENGGEAWIIDPRRFGRIRLAQDPLNEPPISKLGADPLEDFPSASELCAIFAKRRVAIKALLLDQAVFAGVGNWIADEILFQSRLSPHRKANELTPVEIRRLRTRLLSIVKKAVAVGANHEYFPKYWLFHVRWGKVKDSKTTGNHLIRHETIGGRTTAWVPDLQR